MNKYLKIWKDLPTAAKFANGSFLLCGIIPFAIFFIELSQGELIWDALLIGIPSIGFFIFPFMKKYN
tara:strand:- start:190 stop:390 length:201 start_codon:yes stop_codon:yes gene_type:complete